MLRLAILSGDDEQVLLWGDQLDMVALSNGFRAAGEAPTLDRAPFLPDGVKLLIGEPATGMRHEGDGLLWRIAPADALQFAELVSALASFPGPAHQYLDVDVSHDFGIEVKVSKGEYPDSFQP
jgi:hypothetical protein